MDFDVRDARERFLAGLVPGRRSTQSWDVAGWSHGWEGPGSLGPAGGAWWFRAITDPQRLTSTDALYSVEALTAVSARARIAAFLGEANQVLVHWPVAALAPVAFPLREAIGANEAINVLVETIEAPSLGDFFGWLGPIDGSTAQRWIGELTNPDAIAALARASGEYVEALKRLKVVRAMEAADALAREAPPRVEAAWVRAAERPVGVELLERIVDEVDDETFVLLARRCRHKRERGYWDVVSKRLVPDLVEVLLDRVSEPIAPWVYRAFAAGGDAVIDRLVALACGRGKRADAAVRVLSSLDQIAVQQRLDEVDPPTRQKVLAALTPREALPELPRTEWPAAFVTMSTREPAPADWLDVALLPPLHTTSGHRVPDAVARGLVATLQELRLPMPGARGPTPLWPRALLDPESANAWWRALFAMWWSHHQPDVQWVMFAAAYLCDGHAIRDLGASLRRRDVWFGNISSRVVVTIGHNDTDWAVAALDDIAHRAHSLTHRELAERFLDARAAQLGVTTNRYILDHFPDEEDDVLVEAAARRLEDAMVEQSPWFPRPTDKIGFRLVSGSTVWCATNPWGEARFFRLDEDERIDLDGASVEIEPEDVVTVAHPAQLADGELAAWNHHFADYELVQHFDQLGRRRFRAASLSRDGFLSPVGRPVHGGVLRQAERLGWRRVQQGAHGAIGAIERRFEAMDTCARLRFASPLDDDGYAESEVAELQFSTLHADPLDAHDVPKVAFSEAHMDVSLLNLEEP